MKLALGLIRSNGGTQSRAELNVDAVETYADAMRRGEAFPPAIVFYDGKEYWLADGFHREAAAVDAKLSELDVEVRQGTQRDAILFSAGANAVHGVPRTNADKRRAAMVLLADSEWCSWSDRKIASHCAVGEAFVSSLRRELAPAPERISSEPVYRIGADGRRYNVSQLLGKTNKARPIREDEAALLGTIPRDHETIYVLRHEQLVKVGWSRGPWKRVGDLLRDRPGSELVAVAAGTRATERAIHQELHADREHGEWFVSSVADVVATMKRLGLEVATTHLVDSRPSTTTNNVGSRLVAPPASTLRPLPSSAPTPASSATAEDPAIRMEQRIEQLGEEISASSPRVRRVAISSLQYLLSKLLRGAA